MPAPSDAAVSRLNPVGQTLVTGPRAIHPPPVIDDFGWLEPDLRLLWLGDGGATREAVSVFTDDTVNRCCATRSGVAAPTLNASAP